VHASSVDFMVMYAHFLILASWNEMKEAKVKGLDVQSFYLA